MVFDWIERNKLYGIKAISVLVKTLPRLSLVLGISWDDCLIQCNDWVFVQHCCTTHKISLYPVLVTTERLEQVSVHILADAMRIRQIMHISPALDSWERVSVCTHPVASYWQHFRGGASMKWSIDVVVNARRLPRPFKNISKDCMLTHRHCARYNTGLPFGHLGRVGTSSCVPALIFPLRCDPIIWVSLVLGSYVVIRLYT